MNTHYHSDRFEVVAAMSHYHSSTHSSFDWQSSVRWSEVCIRIWFCCCSGNCVGHVCAVNSHVHGRVSANVVYTNHRHAILWPCCQWENEWNDLASLGLSVQCSRMWQLTECLWRCQSMTRLSLCQHRYRNPDTACDSMRNRTETSLESKFPESIWWLQAPLLNELKNKWINRTEDIFGRLCHSQLGGLLERINH